jgi:hypothetical protein
VGSAVFDQLGFEVGPWRNAVDRLDDGFNLLAELVVGYTEDGRVDQFGMHDQQVLRLLRVDVHPARDDHERRPVGQVHVPFPST